MTYKEYLMVLFGIGIGAVPGIITYYFLTTHGGVAGIVNGTQNEELTVTPYTFAELSKTNTEIAQVYTSRPMKISNGQCANSFYRSFALAFNQGGAFSLSQTCESKRDGIVMWTGTAPIAWEVSGEGENQQETLTLSFQAVSEEDSTIHHKVVLQREGGEVSVLSTTLPELPPTTVFIPISITTTESVSVPVLDTTEIAPEF